MGPSTGTAAAIAASRRAAGAFVRAGTALQRAPLVPEIALHLAAHPYAIFQAAEHADVPGERLPPFWAFAWPGGQATARYILDHPEVARGRRVLDIGAGSGIAAIAAAMAGAVDVLAADIDWLAEAAVAINAAANGVAVRTTTADLLGRPPDAELVLVGDLVYEPALAVRVAAFLEAAARTRAVVLVADRTTARRPPVALELVAEHAAPVVPELIEAPFERARVWRVRPASGRGRGGGRRA